MYAMRVTLNGVCNSRCFALNSLMADRNRPGEVPVIDRNVREKWNLLMIAESAISSNDSGVLYLSHIMAMACLIAYCVRSTVSTLPTVFDFGGRMRGWPWASPEGGLRSGLLGLDRVRRRSGFSGEDSEDGGQHRNHPFSVIRVQMRSPPVGVGDT